MMSYYSIPTHITALYVFAAVNLTILLNLSLVEANVVARNIHNKTIWEAPDKEALFGPAIPDEGIWGYLVPQETACCKPGDVIPPPAHNHSVKMITMIKRGPCEFERKVYNAQLKGYDAVIIHNVDSDELERMGPGREGLRVNISSVFIGAHDAMKFEEYCKKKFEFVLWINNDNTFNYWPLLKDFIIIACAAFSFGLIVGLAVLVARWVRDVRHRRRSRLSLAHLKKIPIKKFRKGDQYDVCAICLDEYEDGEKLRILPCSHAYHQKCIDPWLTKNKKFCPICKRKVIPGNDDSDSEDESDDEEGGHNENTPLLTDTMSTGTPAARGGGTFDHSGLPSNLRQDVYRMSYDDTSSEDSFTVSASNYHSSVEVHQPVDDGAVTVPTNQEYDTDDSGDTESADGDDLHDDDAIGATSRIIANASFPIVDDHFSTVHGVGSINGGDNTSSRSSLDEYRPLMEEAVVVAAPVLAPSECTVERDQIV